MVCNKYLNLIVQDRAGIMDINRKFVTIFKLASTVLQKHNYLSNSPVLILNLPTGKH